VGASAAGHPPPTAAVRVDQERRWPCGAGLEGVRTVDRPPPLQSGAQSGGPGGWFKPADIADLLEDADKAEGGEILDQVHSDPELEADVFEELDPEKASRLLNDMPDTEVAALLGRMRATTPPTRSPTCASPADAGCWI